MADANGSTVLSMSKRIYTRAPTDHCSSPINDYCEVAWSQAHAPRPPTTARPPRVPCNGAPANLTLSSSSTTQMPAAPTSTICLAMCVRVCATPSDAAISARIASTTGSVASATTPHIITETDGTDSSWPLRCRPSRSSTLITTPITAVTAARSTSRPAVGRARTAAPISLAYAIAALTRDRVSVGKDAPPHATRTTPQSSSARALTCASATSAAPGGSAAHPMNDVSTCSTAHSARHSQGTKPARSSAATCTPKPSTQAAEAPSAAWGGGSGAGGVAGDALGAVPAAARMCLQNTDISVGTRAVQHNTVVPSASVSAESKKKSIPPSRMAYGTRCSLGSVVAAAAPNRSANIPLTGALRLLAAAVFVGGAC
mmetsp:Transcript_7287/g.18887  ORF Transcript_7287/g.18887 Transcript_7287/m.18887 type:complete len:372 (+) Transcript_7287:145-1260(+)